MENSKLRGDTQMYNLDHLDIFIFLKYTNVTTTLFTKEELIKKVNAEYSIFANEEKLLRLYEGIARPKTYQLVKRLSEMGYSNKTIGKWLNISASTISIHLSKPVEKTKEYRNYKLLEYMNHKLYLLQNFDSEYTDNN